MQDCFEKGLPTDVVADLRTAVASGVEITPELLESLDGRLRLCSRFGITRRRLRNYLQRVQGRSAAEGDPLSSKPGADAHSTNNITTSQATDTRASHDENTRAYHERLKALASILDAALGPLTEHNPHLWELRAYLMVVALVHDRLMQSEAELATGELAALARILAEGRHVGGSDRSRATPDEAQSKSGSREPPDGMPRRIAQAVREIYGTSIPSPTDEPDC